MEKIVRIIEAFPEPVRIDRVLLHEFPLRSRNYFQQLISSHNVFLNGITVKKPSIAVKNGDTIEVTFPLITPLGARPLPAQDLKISVLFEHEDFLIVYKPAGLTVHSPNHYDTSPTLVDWLVHYFSELKTVGEAERPGIVHRLDKDTSGIMIVARTPYAHAHFSALFQERSIEKTYRAFVEGHPQSDGEIDLNIGRHPQHGHKMATQLYSGRTAFTRYQVLEHFPADQYTLLELYPKTGRTHQLRVHCTAIGHPIIGDTIYGKAHNKISRQALHAYRLSFIYKDRYYSFVYDIPEDMRSLISTVF